MSDRTIKTVLRVAAILLAIVVVMNGVWYLNGSLSLRGLGINLTKVAGYLALVSAVRLPDHSLRQRATLVSALVLFVVANFVL